MGGCECACSGGERYREKSKQKHFFQKIVLYPKVVVTTSGPTMNGNRGIVGSLKPRWLFLLLCSRQIFIVLLLKSERLFGHYCFSKSIKMKASAAVVAASMEQILKVIERYQV